MGSEDVLILQRNNERVLLSIVKHELAKILYYSSNKLN